MIIGLSGKIGSGKSTFAELFTSLNPDYKEKSFAYKLKYMVSFITNQPLELMFTHEGKDTYLSEWGMTIGQMQQKLGTEAMRDNFHQLSWILALFADYNENENWIVTDLRFKNEADAILERGGILVRINGDPAGVRQASSRQLDHPSEVDLDDYNKWNFIIENKGSLQQFSNQVDLFNEYIKRKNN